VKTCLRCGQEKPVGEFGLTRAGNPRSWCKPCHAAYKAAWKKTERGSESERRERQRNGEERRQRYKARHPERHAENARKALRNYAARNKDKLREKTRRIRRDRPETYWAGMLVSAMVFFGMMVRRACEVCGEPKAHAHHPDHTKPLAVVWLCASCHGRLGPALSDPAVGNPAGWAPASSAEGTP